VDYDGTITDRDTFDVLVQTFAGPEVWARTERGLDDGTTSIRDVLQTQASYVRGSYPDVSALLQREIVVDPAFPGFVTFCATIGATLTVVSSGIEPIIRERLAGVGVHDVEIVANGIDPDPAGWKIVYRDGSANGTDKAAIVRAARESGHYTIFIGDGRSDYAAATLADRRFAKRGLPLERYLRAEDIAYEGYSSFAEVESALS